MTAHALVLLHLRRNLNIANPLEWALGYMRCASAWYLFEMGKCVVGEHCDAVIHPVISAGLVQNQGNLSTSWRRRDGKLGRKIRLLFTVSKVYRSTKLKRLTDARTTSFRLKRYERFMQLPFNFHFNENTESFPQPNPLWKIRCEKRRSKSQQFTAPNHRHTYS